jgi:hypothetical protein
LFNSLPRCWDAKPQNCCSNASGAVEGTPALSFYPRA